MDCMLLVLAAFVLLPCTSVSDVFRSVIRESPLVVAVGDVAIFTCHTSIRYELKEVRWIRTHAGRRYLINVFFDGKDQQICELPEYVGRTEVMKEDLALGRVALKLFNVSVADEGAYHCYLETVDYFDFGDLELKVTALGSNPMIELQGFQDGGIKAVCRSVGWYPEPTLVNRDNNEMKIQKENGLYSVEYSRIITETSNRTFSCLLHTLFPHQERASSVYVAEDLFQKPTDTALYIIISTIALGVVGAVAAVVGVLCLWIRHRNRKAYGTRRCQNAWLHVRGPVQTEGGVHDASSAANTEMIHLTTPLESGSSVYTLTKSKDPCQ